MRNISLRTHTLLDYLLAILLLVLPWTVPFPDPTTARLSLTAGAILAGYSLLTDYDIAVFRLLPIFLHRILDLLLGAALLFTPLRFAPTRFAAATFVLSGLLLIALALLTRGPKRQPQPNRPAVPGSPNSPIPPP